MCWIFSRLLTYLCEFAWATGSLFICHFIKHMEIDYAHIIGSSNHYPCFSVTWPTHYPGGQNIMDNSRQSAVLQDSVGKCCFFFHLSWAKTTWIIHQWRKKKIGGKICDPYFAQAARWHLLVPNPLPYTDARMNALRVQTATCIFDLDGWIMPLCGSWRTRNSSLLKQK